MIKVKACRNCTSSNVFLSDQGRIAPFFAKRVLNIETSSLKTGDMIYFSLEKTIGKINQTATNFIFSIIKALIGSTELSKQWTFPIETKILICRNCTFVGPDFEYSSKMLSELYYDYRSETYNAERIKYETSYKDIVEHIGKLKEETCRMENLNKIISSNIDMEKIRSILDFGGGDGRFIPANFVDKSVSIIDISNEPCVNSTYLKFSDIPEDSYYDYVQICHVLEHVSNPYALMQNIITHLTDGAFIYIELPKDRNDKDLEQILINDPSAFHHIHEHLNIFCEKSLRALALALNLDEVIIETNTFNLGWCTADVISGLFRLRTQNIGKNQ